MMPKWASGAVNASFPFLYLQFLIKMMSENLSYTYSEFCNMIIREKGEIAVLPSPT